MTATPKKILSTGKLNSSVHLLQKLVGKLQAGLLIQKFKEAILDLGGGRVFEVADYSLTSRAVDYVKEKVSLIRSSGIGLNPKRLAKDENCPEEKKQTVRILLV